MTSLSEQLLKLNEVPTIDVGRMRKLWPKVCAVVEACQGHDERKQADALISLARSMEEEQLDTPFEDPGVEMVEKDWPRG